MPTLDQFIDLITAQAGDRYVFGVEASPSDSDPAAFDCSELIQWACDRLQVSPRMPDGSWNQARHVKANGTELSVVDGINTRGALLFRFSSSPYTGGRPTSSHVAVSLGNGSTFEARSTSHGVGVFSALGRNWTHAGLIPGLTYAPVPAPAPAPAPTSTSNDWVTSWQVILKDLGFDPGIVDGKPGPDTDRALKELVTEYVEANADLHDIRLIVTG